MVRFNSMAVVVVKMGPVAGVRDWAHRPPEWLVRWALVVKEKRMPLESSAQGCDEFMCPLGAEKEKLVSGPSSLVNFSLYREGEVTASLVMTWFWDHKWQ